MSHAKVPDHVLCWCQASSKIHMRCAAIAIHYAQEDVLSEVRTRAILLFSGSTVLTQLDQVGQIMPHRSYFQDSKPRAIPRVRQTEIRCDLEDLMDCTAWSMLQILAGSYPIHPLVKYCAKYNSRTKQSAQILFIISEPRFVGPFGPVKDAACTPTRTRSYHQHTRES